jgi:hypothetical protein
MAAPSHPPRAGLLSHLRRDEPYLRHEFSRIAAHALRDGAPRGEDRLAMLLASHGGRAQDLQADRTSVAVSGATLPIAPEMAWAVPQLLKRVQLVAPGALSTNGALRSLLRMPHPDETFAKAFADSGFLSCDLVLEHERWKYDLTEMILKHHDGSAWQVLEHARALLAQDRTGKPVDWHAALDELRTLLSWFPELRTLQLLEQLYARLAGLHTQSILAVRSWLEWRANVAGAPREPDAWDAAGRAGVASGPFRCERSSLALALQGAQHG